MTRPDADPRAQLGKKGEEYAVNLYRDWGYEILTRNDAYHRLGELDFVVRKDRLLAFVEVRTRSSDSGGHPLETVTPTKQGKILRSARMYLDGWNREQWAEIDEIRFDVAGIVERRYGFAVTVIFGAFEDDRFW